MSATQQSPDLCFTTREFSAAVNYLRDHDGS
jgi:hypothetical protein